MPTVSHRLDSFASPAPSQEIPFQAVFLLFAWNTRITTLPCRAVSFPIRNRNLKNHIVPCSCRGSRYFARSMPNFFMREISVVRLIPMRAAAPSGPPTRPLVTFRVRTISSCASASRCARHRSLSAVETQFSDRSLQRRTAGKDHRTLDEILQLTNIPRPIPT